MKRERKSKEAVQKGKVSNLKQKKTRNNNKQWNSAPAILDPKKVALWLAIISIVTLVAYSSSFNNGITNWDDNEYVVENEFIKVINAESISNIFSELNYMGNYHPLTLVSLAIDYQFAKDNPNFEHNLDPFPFHFTNILLHLIVTLLVFWFTLKLFDNFNIAVIAGLLFGVSALHVESVSWISERKDVLYSAFFVGALVSYLKFLEKKSIVAFVVTILLFVLSLLSKGQAVSLAVSLVAIDWYKGRKLTDMKLIAEKVPFFLLALVFGIVAIKAQAAGDAIISQEAYPFIYRIGFAGYAYMQYIIELTIPYGFSAINPYPDIINKSIPAYYWLYLLPALTTLYALYYTVKTKKKAATFGIAFFIINIFLLLQFLPVGSAIHADRYAYIPSIGYVILAGVLAEDLIKKKKSLKMAVYTLIGLFAGVQTYATYERAKVWESSETLWEDTVKKSPKAVVAWNNKGSVADRTAVEFAEKFDFENSKKYRLQAISDFGHAVRWKPDYVNAFYNRGSTKQSLGKEQKDSSLIKSSIEDFNSALTFDPLFAPAYHNRGTSYDELGNSAKAVEDYTTAIDIKANDPQYFVNRGVAYGKLNQLKKSVLDFDKALLLNPQSASVYANRGLAKVKSKDFEGGLQDYNKTIELDPNFRTVYFNRGLLYRLLKKYPEAVVDLTKAISNNPNNAEAYYYRGVCYIEVGNNDAACEDFNKAISLGLKGVSQIVDKYCK